MSEGLPHLVSGDVRFDGSGGRGEPLVQNLVLLFQTDHFLPEKTQKRHDRPHSLKNVPQDGLRTQVWSSECIKSTVGQEIFGRINFHLCIFRLI